MNKQNHARKFNSIMPIVNETWASNVLNVPRNSERGPDLIDNGKFVEIKFFLIKPKDNGAMNYPRAWTVLEHQTEYSEYWNGVGFWGLGTYELKCPVSEIETEDHAKLEGLVKKRELYIVKWDWINQYSTSNCSGKTYTSKWKNQFRYPKLKDIPKTEQTYKVKKGLVHLTQGVEDYLFNIQETPPTKL